jgi:hypothetical protein
LPVYPCASSRAREPVEDEEDAHLIGVTVSAMRGTMRQEIEPWDKDQMGQDRCGVSCLLDLGHKGTAEVLGVWGRKEQTGCHEP